MRSLISATAFALVSATAGPALADTLILASVDQPAATTHSLTLRPSADIDRLVSMFDSEAVMVLDAERNRLQPVHVLTPAYPATELTSLIGTASLTAFK